MAKLKIVRQDGSVIEGEITPAVEYAFELYAKMGFPQGVQGSRTPVTRLLACT